MYALWSFGPLVCEQLDRECLLALYIAGGTTACYGSVLNKLITRTTIPSLGASGSIFAIATTFVVFNPDSQMAFIFLPMIPFAATTLLKACFLFDCFGMFAAARGIMNIGLDHAGHLGGMIFGYSYAKFIEERRKSVKKRVKVS